MTPAPCLRGVFTAPGSVPLIKQPAVPHSGRGQKGPAGKLQTRLALFRWTCRAGQRSLLFFKSGTRGEKKKKTWKRYLTIKEKLLFCKVIFFLSLKYNGKLTRYWSLVLPSKMEAQKQGTCHIKCVRPSSPSECTAEVRCKYSRN